MSKLQKQSVCNISTSYVIKFPAQQRMLAIVAGPVITWYHCYHRLGVRPTTAVSPDQHLMNNAPANMLLGGG